MEGDYVRVVMNSAVYTVKKCEQTETSLVTLVTAEKIVFIALHAAVDEWSTLLTKGVEVKSSQLICTRTRSQRLRALLTS